jgi:hypothetical protein
MGRALPIILAASRKAGAPTPVGKVRPVFTAVPGAAHTDDPGEPSRVALIDELVREGARRMLTERHLRVTTRPAGGRRSVPLQAKNTIFNLRGSGCTSWPEPLSVRTGSASPIALAPIPKDSSTAAVKVVHRLAADSQSLVAARLQPNEC